MNDFHLLGVGLRGSSGDEWCVAKIGGVSILGTPPEDRPPNPVEHHRLIVSILRTAAFLPARYGALLNASALLVLDDTRAGKIAENVARFAGAMEVSLRAHWQEPANQVHRHGRDYLKAQRARFQSRTAASAALDSLLSECEADPNVLYIVREGGRGGNTAMHSAIGYQPAEVVSAMRCIRERLSGVVNLSVAGPWPAYGAVDIRAEIMKMGEAECQVN